jgi:hypothetical protein
VTEIEISETVFFFTPSLSPSEFGAYSNHIFAGDVGNNIIYAYDLATDELISWKQLSLGSEQVGPRQIAFSPPGWFEPINPLLAGKSVLLLSVAGSGNGGESGGSLLAFDHEARLVATFDETDAGVQLDPRGLLFMGSELFVTNTADGTVLRVTAEDFGIGNCNGNFTLDECELANGRPDCNENGQPDSCDLLDNDCNDNYVPDTCESDTDGDGIIDACDLSGDFDEDGDVDLEDFSLLRTCLEFSGPNVEPVFDECSFFDSDDDNDVDLFDMNAFAAVFTGAM